MNQSLKRRFRVERAKVCIVDGRSLVIGLICWRFDVDVSVAALCGRSKNTLDLIRAVVVGGELSSIGPGDDDSTSAFFDVGSEHKRKRPNSHAGHGDNSRVSWVDRKLSELGSLVVDARATKKRLECVVIALGSPNYKLMLLAHINIGGVLAL